MLVQLNGNLTIIGNLDVVLVVLTLLVLEVQAVILVVLVCTTVPEQAEGHDLFWLVTDVLNLVAPWQDCVLLNEER